MNNPRTSDTEPTMSILPMQKIVVVDDDADLRELLCEYLSKNSFQVTAAASGSELDNLLSDGSADLIVLDLMMPGEDGLSICRRLRAKSRVPILMLTAAGEAVDRVVGIELGADDYMAKPFLPRELLARIRAILRRATNIDVRGSARTRYRFAGWILDEYDCSLHSETHGTLRLTGGEYRLLHSFVTSPGRVLSRDALAEAVRGRSIDAFERSVDVAVSRMRKKLAGESGPNLIKSVHALGYVFSAKVEVVSE
jgi:two-component system, OmpR family, response regulator